MLTVDSVRSAYGDMEVLHGVSLHVTTGTAVVLIGSNGAGKSTLLNCVMGLQAVADGTITISGENVRRLKTEERTALGVAYVPEGRTGLFRTLTVEESLAVAASGGRRKRAYGAWDFVRELFPRLEERRRQTVGTLSGGEQQMLSLCCALVREPKILILDEPSLGLAPIIGREVYRALIKLKEEGMTMLIVEERAEEALKVADYLYVMQVGRIVHAAHAEEVRESADLSRLIFGLNES